ncbi:MAG: hypothetical protein GY791_17085 [Alphaproteobacteria bacterium]|nr:hypothetical protein [Alphaproteobacteria bacterium]
MHITIPRIRDAAFFPLSHHGAENSTPFTEKLARNVILGASCCKFTTETRRGDVISSFRARRDALVTRGRHGIPGRQDDEGRRTVARCGPAFGKSGRLE